MQSMKKEGYLKRMEECILKNLNLRTAKSSQPSVVFGKTPVGFKKTEVNQLVSRLSKEYEQEDKEEDEQNRRFESLKKRQSKIMQNYFQNLELAISKHFQQNLLQIHRDYNSNQQQNEKLGKEDQHSETQGESPSKRYPQLYSQTYKDEVSKKIFHHMNKYRLHYSKASNQHSKFKVWSESLAEIKSILGEKNFKRIYALSFCFMDEIHTKLKSREQRSAVRSPSPAKLKSSRRHQGKTLLQLSKILAKESPDQLKSISSSISDIIRSTCRQKKEIRKQLQTVISEKNKLSLQNRRMRRLQECQVQAYKQQIIKSERKRLKESQSFTKLRMLSRRFRQFNSD